MQTTTTPRYRTLGTTEDHDTCDCCGRTNLKKTVALEDLTTGDITYFGTSCAAQATGWTTTEVTRAARQADDAKRQAEARARDAARQQQDAAYRDWLAAQTGADRATLDTEAIHDVARTAYGSSIRAWGAYHAATRTGEPAV